MAEANKFDPELLLAAVEGELTAAQRKQVEAAITDDPRVGKLLESMRADRQALRAMPDPSAPHWLMDEVDRQLERDMLVGAGVVDSHVDAVRDAHVFRRMMVYGAVAAMLAIVATVILSSLSVPTPEPLDPSPVATDDTPRDPVDPVDPDRPVDPTPVIDKPDVPHVADGSNDPTPEPPVFDVPAPISIDEALASAADAARDPELLAALVLGERRGPSSVDDALDRALVNGGSLPDRGEAPFPRPLAGDTPGTTIRELIDDPSLPGPTPRPETNDPIESPGDPITSPGDAPQVDARTRPVLNVADRDATLKRIDRLAEQHDGSRVPGASDAPGTVVYELPAGELPAFVAALRTVVGDNETLTLDRDAKAAPKLGDTPWPSLVPDYLSILDQQFPEAADAEPATVKLPVKVMQQRAGE